MLETTLSPAALDRLLDELELDALEETRPAGAEEHAARAGAAASADHPAQ